MRQIFLETRMFRLSDGEEIMALAFFVVTDGQTDIAPLAIPAVCIARYANALVKMAQQPRVNVGMVSGYDYSQ